MSPTGLEINGVDMASVVRRALDEHLVERLARTDTSLWAQSRDGQEGVGARLGWFDVAQRMTVEAMSLCEWGRSFSDEIDDVVILGMGGSGLAPEVMAAMLPAPTGRPKLTLLDSTDPAAVRRLTELIAIDRTIFIVASKSGTTLETLCLYAIFRQQYVDKGLSDYESHFVAITDPGTPLAVRARDDGFGRVFLNDPQIGGRYSALSYFGLVPAALIGIDIELLLSRAVEGHRVALAELNPDQNPAVQLGLALGVLAQRGVNKLTLVPSVSATPLGPWIEQLVAESTGKFGRGIVPVDGEQIGSPAVYGDDRVFVGVAVEGETAAGLESLSAAGHPVLALTMADVHDLGAEFFHWELATAVAGWVLDVNPFDQPDVEASKVHTRRALEEMVRDESVKCMCEGLPGPALRVHGDADTPVFEALTRFFGQAREGDYVSIHAYFERSSLHESRMRQIQAIIRDRTRLATTVGFGPRFLHSTGQLHKGGANTGLFVQITAEHPRGLCIPGRFYGLGTLIDAQASGDYQSLTGKRCRILRLRAYDVEKALDDLARIAAALV